MIGFHWADEQTVQLKGAAAEIPQDHPAVAAVNPASSTCSTAWYSGSSSLPILRHGRARYAACEGDCFRGRRCINIRLTHGSWIIAWEMQGVPDGVELA